MNLSVVMRPRQLGLRTIYSRDIRERHYLRSHQLFSSRCNSTIARLAFQMRGARLVQSTENLRVESRRLLLCLLSNATLEKTKANPSLQDYVGDDTCVLRLTRVRVRLRPACPCHVSASCVTSLHICSFSVSILQAPSCERRCQLLAVFAREGALTSFSGRVFGSSLSRLLWDSLSRTHACFLVVVALESTPPLDLGVCDCGPRVYGEPSASPSPVVTNCQ